MRRQLSDSLLLRAAESDHDVDALVDFNSTLHSNFPEPDPRIGQIIREMLTSGLHPTIAPEDFFLVEDTATNQIVSSLCVIPQTWTYAGIPFGVGRPEFVGTLAEYRRQGLVRELFEAAHERSVALNLPVQSITGIPYFYRQFEYEYALELGGGRVMPLAMLPPTPDSSLSLRAVSEADIPTLQTLYDSFARKHLIVCPRPVEMWRYLLNLTEANGEKHWFYMILRDGKPLGYVDIAKEMQGSRARTTELVFNGPMPALATWLPPRLRDEIAITHAGAAPAAEYLYLHLGGAHPLYPYLGAFQPFRQPPYAWYIRVPDLAAFVMQIAPALAKRIAAGPLAGLTSILTLDFYRSALKLTFEGGSLVEAANLPPGAPGDVLMPPLVFLQLLFGYRSTASLAHAFPDVRLNQSGPLLDALFPRRRSWVRPLT